VSDAAAAAGGAPFGFAEFALVGVPLTDATADRPASDAREHDGHGPGGLPLRGLRDARVAVVGVFSS
jgi:hypothetical protein